MLFYRISKTNPPTLKDFQSNEAQGKPPLRALSPQQAHLWTGLSVYDSEEQALRTAREYPDLGSFIAEIELPETGNPFRIERTGSRGHHTLWGDTETLLSLVQNTRALPQQ